MNPKEKAKELVGKYMDCHISTVPMTRGEAAKCALILVEELLIFGVPRYWNKVKQELEKI